MTDQSEPASPITRLPLASERVACGHRGGLLRLRHLRRPAARALPLPPCRAWAGIGGGDCHRARGDKRSVWTVRIRKRPPALKTADRRNLTAHGRRRGVPDSVSPVPRAISSMDHVGNIGRMRTVTWLDSGACGLRSGFDQEITIVSVHPVVWLPVTVSYRDNHDGLASNDVGDEVRKYWAIHPSVAALAHAPERRIL